jgi:hypothetical protein
MELHHHSNLAHGFKGWKSFLWEFLMLFLAVFAASLAEYQLEHKIERDKGKQYIKSLVVDLAADTTNLGNTIRDFNSQIQRMDTVLARYDQLTTNFNDTLLRNIIQVIGYPDFFITDRTMQQLKNSGAMRLIRNQVSANAILDYDAKSRYLMNSSQPSLDAILNTELLPVYHDLIDIRELSHDYSHKTVVQLYKENKTYLLQNNKVVVGKFYNSLSTFRITCESNVQANEIALKKQATELIKLLKKEYVLE